MTKLIGVGDLFKNTWKIYQEKFSLIAGLMVSPFLLIALNQILFQTGGGVVRTLGSIISLIASIGVLWAGAGVLMALSNSQPLTIKEAYRLSWGKLISLVWVAVLVSFIVGGSFMLLVIPGIILIVWLVFAQVIVVLEGENGLHAIVKSREYVRGYFWPILGRFLVVAMTVIIAYAILMVLARFIASLLGSPYSLGSVIVFSLLVAIVNIIIFPFGAIYTYLMYGNLKQVKGQISIDPTKKQGLRYLLVGLVGWVFATIFMIFFLSLLMTLLAGLFFGQALGGLNLGTQEGFSKIVPKAPINLPAGLTAEQQKQMQVQLEAMKKLQEQLKAQMPAGIPVPTE